MVLSPWWEGIPPTAGIHRTCLWSVPQTVDAKGYPLDFRPSHLLLPSLFLPLLVLSPHHSPTRTINESPLVILSVELAWFVACCFVVGKSGQEPPSFYLPPLTNERTNEQTIENSKPRLSTNPSVEIHLKVPVASAKAVSHDAGCLGNTTTRSSRRHYGTTDNHKSLGILGDNNDNDEFFPQQTEFDLVVAGATRLSNLVVVVVSCSPLVLA